MQNTEQTLSTAIGELSCLNPSKPATIDELTALSTARDCIEQLLRSCVDELRTHPDITYSWSAIADALGSPTASAARQRYAAPTPNSDDHILSFWRDYAVEFAWDFLPYTFLYALYEQWLTSMSLGETRPSRSFFSGHLRSIATASGDWVHTRSRPGSLMSAVEPLAVQLTAWSHDHADKAVYGLRRSKTLRKYSRSTTSTSN